MNLIIYKDIRFGKNYYDFVIDYVVFQEVNYYNYFEFVYFRMCFQNKFSFMGGDLNLVGYVYNVVFLL